MHDAEAVAVLLRRALDAGDEVGVRDHACAVPVIGARGVQHSMRHCVSAGLL
jgi:hypothetical protein